MNRFLLAAALALLLIGAARASEVSRVPAWDARGLGPLPWQGIACVDVNADGSVAALGTISPPGDPNLIVLDAHGKVVSQRRVGLRWVDEVTVSADGRLVAALTGTPEGTAGDAPRLYAFRQDQALTDVGGNRLANLSFRGRLGEARSNHFGGRLFHFGDHSNHLSPALAKRAGNLLVAADDGVLWLGPGAAESAFRAGYGQQGFLTALAAGDNGLAIVGLGGVDAGSGKNLVVLRPDKAAPVVWRRTANRDVAPSPAPEPACYGPSGPQIEDVAFQAPLAVAIDATGERFAVADYEGRRRVCRPKDGGPDFPFGVRFTPSRPTIHVYDAKGAELRRVGPESFPELTWCDLTFTADGRRLLLSPHNWVSRGLGGQPFLPIDERARTLYLVDLASGAVETSRLPDAISSVAVGGDDRIAVGCWNHHVYLLDGRLRPLATLPDGLDVGAASLVRSAGNGQRLIVATAAGVALALDRDGRSLWRTDLNQAVRPGDKPWTKQQKAGEPLVPGVWRTNGGLAHSDMGSQLVVQAPDGLLLIDPNAGASFEQNWAKIAGAGLDPRQVKYVLLTHEHGDHAPGAYLWRLITGAQVVAGVEAADLLQHHIPGGTGYGFHPPQPVDIRITQDTVLDLAGLKVRCLRLPGHTYGSMGYAFETDGRLCVATGDLIMPGGVLGYSGSMNFSAEDVLASLRKLHALNPAVVLGGHGSGPPDEFIAKGIAIGEATGWSRMKASKPDPLYGFAQTNYLVAAWCEPLRSAAFGDVDGDGRPDVTVLTAKGAGSAVKVFLNKASRSAEKGVRNLFPERPEGCFAQKVPDTFFSDTPDAVVDVPQLTDGWKLGLTHLGTGKTADIIATSEGQAMLLLAEGDRLAFRVSPLGVTRGARFFAGDFTGQGQPGLLIGSRFVSALHFINPPEGRGSGMRMVKTAKTYFDVELVDLNADGRADVITSGGELFLRQPNGTLAEAPAFTLKTPADELKGFSFMAAADFNHDGACDLVFLANDDKSARLWLYLNTKNRQPPFASEPNGTFVIKDTVVNRDGPTVADWNGDGIPDLFLQQTEKENGVRILLGAADGGLAADRRAAIRLDYAPHFDTRLGVADFNGDGLPDIAGFGTAKTGATGVYIWLRTSDCRE